MSQCTFQTFSCCGAESSSKSNNHVQRCRSPLEQLVTSFVIGIVVAVGIALAILYSTDLSATWTAVSGTGGGILATIISYTTLRCILGKQVEKSEEEKSQRSNAAQASTDSQGLVLFDETFCISNYAAVVAFENIEKREQWIAKAKTWSCFYFKNLHETTGKCFVSVTTRNNNAEAARPAIRNVLLQLGLPFRTSTIHPISTVYNGIDCNTMTLRFKNREDGLAWLDLVRGITSYALSVTGTANKDGLSDAFITIKAESLLSMTQIFKEVGLSWEEATSSNTAEAIISKHQKGIVKETKGDESEKKVEAEAVTQAFLESKGLVLLDEIFLISNYAVVVSFEDKAKRKEWIDKAQSWSCFQFKDYRETLASDTCFVTLCTIKEAGVERPTIKDVLKLIGLPLKTHSNYPNRIVNNKDNSMTLHFKDSNDGLVWLNLLRPTDIARLHVCDRTQTTLTIKPHEFNDKITDIFTKAGLTWEEPQLVKNIQPQRIVYNGYQPNTMTMQFVDHAEGLAWFEQFQTKCSEIDIDSSSDGSFTFKPKSGMSNITDIFTEAGLTWEEVQPPKK